MSFVVAIDLKNKLIIFSIRWINDGKLVVICMMVVVNKLKSDIKLDETSFKLVKIQLLLFLQQIDSRMQTTDIYIYTI